MMAFEKTAINLLDSQKEICSFGRMNMGSTRLKVSIQINILCMASGSLCDTT
jgi:hypothetical protein